jgi:hypothetical protein
MEINFTKAKLDMETRTLSLELTEESLEGVRESLERREPTLDDYRTIKSYVDACKALGEEPFDFEETCDILDPHIVALMQLETISRALWGRDFEPEPQGEWDGETYYYWPWFRFYSEEDMAKIKANPSGCTIAALFAGYASAGAAAGFGYLSTNNRPADTGAHIGFRLCQETEERARYFGVQFANLWADYLAYGFEIEERVI